MFVTNLSLQAGYLGLRHLWPCSPLGSDATCLGFFFFPSRLQCSMTFYPYLFLRLYVLEKPSVLSLRYHRRQTVAPAAGWLVWGACPWPRGVLLVWKPRGLFSLHSEGLPAGAGRMVGGTQSGKQGTLRGQDRAAFVEAAP